MSEFKTSALLHLQTLQLTSRPSYAFVIIMMIIILIKVSLLEKKYIFQMHF